MQLRLPIASGNLLVECHDRCEQAGRAVLRTLAELDRRGPSLHDDSRVQYGWSVLTLRLEGADLRVWEPDYLGDALRDLRPTLDLTLEVIEEQAEVLRGRSEEGVDARFDHFVTAWPGAPSASNIFLTRQAAAAPDDTGWFIGDLARLDVPPEGELEVFRVFELMKRRRSVMKLLAFPPGYAVVMAGDETESVMSGQG